MARLKRTKVTPDGGRFSRGAKTPPSSSAPSSIGGRIRQAAHRAGEPQRRQQRIQTRGPAPRGAAASGGRAGGTVRKLAKGAVRGLAKGLGNTPTGLVARGAAGIAGRIRRATPRTAPLSRTKPQSAAPRRGIAPKRQTKRKRVAAAQRLEASPGRKRVAIGGSAIDDFRRRGRA